MLSLIEVKCPHCGAKGQIMSPPAGSIIVGPCPECQELVVVFCGQVLPLKREIMLSDSVREKRDHLMAVLTHFIRQRVVQVVAEGAAADHASDEHAPAQHKIVPTKNEEAGTAEARESSPTNGRGKASKSPGPIRDEELEAFRSDDLRLIDNGNYFKAIFG